MSDPNILSIKGYELRERIGAGGFGVVYRAYQSSVDRDVAIKVILPEYANQPEFIRRFESEAQLIARLEHPHIVPLYDYWRNPEGAYLVMRWYRGNLSDTIRHGVWTLEATARLLEQIAGALSVAHRAGVIHCDIKPENILLDEDDNAYLADFGIALVSSAPNPTQDAPAANSSSALTPEQIRAEAVSRRTDIYSLGIVIYELLTAQKPFPNAVGKSEFLNAHLNTPLPRLTSSRQNFPAALDEVLHIATAKDPAQRYSSAVLFAAAFRAAIPTEQHRTTQPLPDPLTERELAILRLMPEGLSNPEIAERLYLSPSTVKWYAKEIYRKLDVHSRSEAIARGRQLRLLGSDEIETPILSVEQPSVSPQAPELVNPYKGLRAFQEADESDFFGREALTAQLLARLSADPESGRFLAVVGASGSGKSSAVKAGLIPALRKGKLRHSDRWFITEMLPGTHPMEELEAALVRVSLNPLPDMFAQITEDARGLARAVKQILPADPDTELVLVIDQFEELFTLTEDAAVRAHFIDTLVSVAADPRSRIRVILTLRADFYDRPLLFPGLAALMRSHTEVIIPLTASELERAIAAPAERVGLSLEQGLVATIVNDVGEQAGTLPMLQYALSELYEQREARALTLRAYRQMGGISAPLAHRADSLYEALDEDGKAAAHQLFLRLITLGEGVEDTRRRVSQAELATLQAADVMEDVIEVFSQYRLLTLDRDPLTRSPTVEIAHEALIREWGRLRDWLTESRESLRIQRRLMAAAREWLHGGRDASFLASGARLVQFEVLLGDAEVQLNQEERDYVAASIVAREQQEQTERERQARELRTARQSANRLRALVGVLAVFLLVTGGLSVVALNSRADALNSANSAQTNFTHAEAQRLAAESNNLQVREGNSELASLLALRSMNLQYTPQGDEALTTASFLDLPLRVISSQHGGASAPVFSPDGKIVATGNANGSATLWDVATGQEIRSFVGHTAGSMARLSPDGSLLVTASNDTTVRLWDVATGEQIREFDGHTAALEDVVFSPDGKTIASGADDHTARLWDVQTGKEIREFIGHSDIVIGVAFSPDGKTLITGGDTTVRFWNMQNGQELRQIETGASVNALGISHDGTMLATGTDDFVIRLWDVQSGQMIRLLTGHTAGIRTVVFSPDDQTLLSASNDYTARLWDVATGTELRRFFGYSVSLSGASFAPDGRSIVTVGNSDIKFWSLARNPRILSLDAHNGILNGVLFSPNGSSLLTVEQGGTAHLWDIQTDQIVRTFGKPGQPAYALAISPDGRHVLTTQGRATTTVTLWDVQTGMALHEFDSPGGIAGFQTVAFSPDSRYALFSDGVNLIHLFDVQSWLEVRRIAGHDASIASVSYAPNGSTVFTGAADFTARLWDASNGQQIFRFPILVWEPGTNRTVLSPDTGGWSTAYSPDGQLLAAGSWGGSIYIWDFATGRWIKRLVGQIGEVMVTFSADGRYLLSAGGDGTLRLWDVNTWQEVRRLVTTIFSLGAISPDSQYLLNVIGLNSAELVPVDYRQIIRDLCRRVTRDLTDDERRAYDITDTSPTCPAEPLATSIAEATEWMTPTPPVWTPLAPIPFPTEIPTGGPTPTNWIFAAADMTVEPPN